MPFVLSLSIMGQNIINATLLLLLAQPMASCSKEAASPRDIRAHATSHKGVAHAEPALAAERYCAACHGVGLKGGAAGEPSCYTCHGKTWLDSAFVSAAPQDHTVINQEFRHGTNLFSPATDCVSCHGANFQGDTTGGLTVPGCELCHVRLWEERSPPANILLREVP